MLVALAQVYEGIDNKYMTKTNRKMLSTTDHADFYIVHRVVNLISDKRMTLNGLLTIEDEDVAAVVVVMGDFDDDVRCRNEINRSDDDDAEDDVNDEEVRN